MGSGGERKNRKETCELLRKGNIRKGRGANRLLLARADEPQEETIQKKKKEDLTIE